MTSLILVSHHLCPYVQRAAISLAEKAVGFNRIYVDLANKPDWFKALSPLGKVPLLRVANGRGEAVIFESAVILEYLEETQPTPLHPHEPLERARHRSWIEFGSSILNRIAGFYNAKTDEALEAEARSLAGLFARVENELADGPWFSGERFSLVDAVYGPIFRYFDVFDRIGEFGILQGKPKAAGWRRSLSERPSIMKGVSPDYESRLLSFLKNRATALSGRIGGGDAQLAEKRTG